MAISSPDDPLPSAWSALGPVEQAREWEEFRPGTFEQIFAVASEQARLRSEFMEIEAKEARLRSKYAEIEGKHERRLDYIAVAMQVTTLVFALMAVVVMSLTAKYYADHGAASDGVKIFGFGAASIVAAFLGVNVSPVTSRLRIRKDRKKLTD